MKDIYKFIQHGQEPGRKIYVQHRLKEHGAEVWNGLKTVLTSTSVVTSTWQRMYTELNRNSNGTRRNVRR